MKMGQLCMAGKGVDIIYAKDDKTADDMKVIHATICLIIEGLKCVQKDIQQHFVV